MQAITLAAGEGSRMRPLTSSRPKVMLPVAGKPFLEHVVERASRAGIDEFVFVVGYRSESVMEKFKDGSDFGVDIEYAVQKERRGTGDALMAAREMAEEEFLVLNGDVLADATSLKRIVDAGGPAVAAKRVSDPSRYGVFEIEAGRLKSVTEKSRSPPSDLANAGIYLLNGNIFDVMRNLSVSERGEYELTDGLSALLSTGAEIRVAEIEEWIEIGRPWDLLSANEKLAVFEEYSVFGDVEANVTLSERVFVGAGTRIRSGSYIEGPVIIGEGCDIGPNCFIRPYSSIGDNVRVGNAVEIKNSTIMENSKIGHLSYVGDSVVGANCNFGAGTVVANLRHDGADIHSYINGEKTDSERRKLGVIMGDDVKTGINTTIYPGTVINSGYRGDPGEAIRGWALPKGDGSTSSGKV